MKKFYTAFIKRLISKTFNLSQKLGWHVTLNHFYEPIPDTRTLKPELWTRDSDLVGVEMKEEEQLRLLSSFASEFKGEYERFPKERTSDPNSYYIDNNSFAEVDGEILYCMVRNFKPSKMIEIGSGFSTTLSAQAMLKNSEENGDGACDLIVIDPYPRIDVVEQVRGSMTLIPKKVEDVPLSEFEKLGPGDFLFIDSSHVLKIGSDVQYEFLEIIPRLSEGVIIHIHDIFLPQEYPREWIFKEHHFWNEQYLLQAFLAFNDSFEVLWSGSFMNAHHPDELASAFGSYRRGMTRPGSFWMRKIN